MLDMLDAIATRSFRRPRFRRAEEAPSFQLTERDIEIVRQVAQHRFLRSIHLSQLLDAPHHKIRERLTSLFHAGYLDRPRSQLEYHLNGGGSAPLVYALGNRGAKLLIKVDGLEHANVDWARKNTEAGRQFLLHTLAIADVRVALTVACRHSEGISLQHPKDLLATLPEETRGTLRPWSWRVRVQHKGAIAQIGLLPDYVFALVFADGSRRVFFVECDRGTMPVERSVLNQTSMLRKFLAYEGGRKQQLHTKRFGWKNFRVLVITASVERVDTMRQVVERVPEIKGSPLFLFADHAALLQSDILTHPWIDAHGNTHTLR